MTEVTKKRTAVLIRARRHTGSIASAPPRPSSAGVELERRERQLAALYELWRAAPHTDLERLLKNVTERVVAALDAHTGSVFLRERGTDVLRMVASVGLAADVSQSVTLLMGERIAGRVAETRQPILVNRDPHTHPLLAENEITKRPEVESALCAPLLGITDEALGVLCVSRHAPATQYTDSDLRIFSLFAAQAGAVIAQRQTIDDLTQAAKDQAKLEREMERSKALAAMGQLAATIAHELRNPLGSIKGAAQFLLQDNRDETVRDFLNIVVEEVDGLGTLTTDLLEFARPAAPVCQETDLVVLTKAEVSFLREELARLGCSKIQEHYSVEKARVEVDVALLGRALRNLLLNAAQAMASVGNTRVDSQVVVRIVEEAPGWCLQVEDNGPGLPSDVIEQLWEPFFTTKARGTGLGLAQVRKTIEAQGGTIRAENVATGGACFSLVLPPAKITEDETV
ncbi:GAF domain-containing protein [Armatimonas sp.]|uniref:GAF domain-containing protein n=1 Tax=Armatimonas sp. TaxID=1872638 RepID=UPI00286B92D5|nr:GAF domain-containing protein [Armatimonas sp.]